MTGDTNQDVGRPEITRRTIATRTLRFTGGDLASAGKPEAVP
ncbi:MAG: hypothetical protein KatS3mg111_4327 [Pirellulaceae bacterium]|nr:MAG: hypothetical protein KatS3mg111_4327 [Pirellulaceae bacterium]